MVEAVGRGLERLAAGDLTFRLDEPLPPAYEALRFDLNSAMGQLEGLVEGITAIAFAIRAESGTLAVAATDLSRRTEAQATRIVETAAALSAITATVHQAPPPPPPRAAGGAAQAGYAGGFAIVAAEVRTLAQRTGEAAKRIRGLTTISTGHVVKGVRLVGEAGQSLDRILGQIGEVSSAVAGIAASTQTQASGLAEVNGAVQQMDEARQQNTVMVAQSTDAVQALRAKAERLAELAGRFRVAGQHGARDGSLQGEASFRAAAKPKAIAA